MTSSCGWGWSLERGLVRSLLVLLSRLEGSLIGFATTGWKDDFPKWKGEGGTLNMSLNHLAEGLSAVIYGGWSLVCFKIIRRSPSQEYKDEKGLEKRKKGKQKKKKILNVTQTQFIGSGRHRVTTFPKVSASGIQSVTIISPLVRQKSNKRRQWPHKS